MNVSFQICNILIEMQMFRVRRCLELSKFYSGENEN